jgi:UDP-2-acetamido-2-deoxy-ribo-hexuluronate aminotransferase
MTPVKLFQTERVWAEISQEVMHLVNLTHQKGQAQNSDLVRDLESRLATLFNRRHCITLANCTDALTVGIISLNLPSSTKIGVSDYTFTASAHAIARAGHTAVALDVGDDYCVLPNKNIEVVLAVDVFGNMTNIDQFDVPVIMDCAQSFESKLNNVWSAKRGVFSCVSFSPSKTISSWGSGGALLTDDDSIADTAKRLRLHGKISNTDTAIHPGLNSMISTFEAACIWVGLNYSDIWSARRRHIAQYLCNESPYQSAINWNQDQHTLHKLVFQSKDVAAATKKLQQHNVEYARHYQKLIHTESLYQAHALECHNSLQLSKISFTVPNQHTLTDSEVEQIAKGLK